MAKKKYRVYFFQENQCHYEEQADNRDEAIEKATTEWKREHRQPIVSSVEEL